MVERKIPKEPTTIQAGLAMYALGEGERLLLMPYPHGLASTVEHELTEILTALDRQVLTFDPPGSFASEREAQMTMAEMLDGADETLAAFEIEEPVTVAGHSMSGFCALAFALERPEQVKNLVLIGTLSGGSAINRFKGLPWYLPWHDLNRWRHLFWGARLALGLGNLAVHKNMQRLLGTLSLVDKSFAPEIEIEPGDKEQPAPRRATWPRTILRERIDFRKRLGEIKVPTLICTGRFDPQTPVGCSEELARGIAGSRLHIFEKSGHSPFIEEGAAFKELLGSFFSEQAVD